MGAKLSQFVARPILPYSPFFSRFRSKIRLGTYGYVKTKHNDRSVSGSSVHSTGTNTRQMSPIVNASLYLTSTIYDL